MTFTSRRDFLRGIGFGTAAAALTSTSEQVAWSSAPSKAASQNAVSLIRLNQNENVYGPSRSTLTALRNSMRSTNRYAETRDLAAAIARYHGVNQSEVLIGCGSTEIVRMAAQAFLRRGTFIQASPTFTAPEYYARANGAKIESVPLTAEFSHDFESMLSRVSRLSTLIYICNPNNPTGSITPRDQVEAFVAQLPPTSHVVIDEAYHHYAGQSSRYSSFLDHRIDDDRVIVMRTFSKIYALAGLRLGYAIASPSTIERMGAFATLHNVNNIVAHAAVSALEDQQSVQESVLRNANDRQEFFNQAMARMLKPIDSHTNFVMMNTHHTAAEAVRHFRDNNILIGGPFSAMNTYIRVSLGNPTEMQAFWHIWDQLPYANMHH